MKFLIWLVKIREIFDQIHRDEENYFIMVVWTKKSWFFENKVFQLIKLANDSPLSLGGVHKLRLQEEGVGGQKNRLFVNFYTIENVNGGG